MDIATQESIHPKAEAVTNPARPRTDPDEPAVEQPIDWPAAELLAANLAALRTRDAELADRIESVTVPDEAELARANDGSVSYRIRQPDGRRRWLGYTSIPRVVARANARRTQIGTANLAMDGIGSGAEVEAVLQQMAPFQALFVAEADPLILGLVLRLRDFTEPLRRGRLVLLAGPDAADALEQFLLDHPGYGLVTQTITWLWRCDRDNQAFAQRLARAMQRCAEAARARLTEQLARQAPPAGPTDAGQSANEELLSCLQQPALLRAVNCTQAYTPMDIETSRDALAGLERLGAQVDHLVLDQPDRVSTCFQMARLERIRPRLILLVDQLRSDLPYPLPPESICVSLLRQPPLALFGSDAAAAACASGRDFLAAAERHHLDTLQKSGWPAERLIHLPLAADPQRFGPVTPDENDRQRYGAQVVMVADRCRLDPLAYQIKLPFQQQLWQAAIEEIRRRADSYQAAEAPELLNRACRRSGIELQDEELQQYFRRLIRNVMGDTVLRDVYAEHLVRAGIDLKLFTWTAVPDSDEPDQPLGWDDSPVADRLVGALADADSLNRLCSTAGLIVYVSGAPRVEPWLLNAAAAGATVLIRSTGRTATPDGIEEYFEIGKEMIAFEGVSDLVRKVRYYTTHPDRRAAVGQAARAKVLARHNITDRMKTLLTYLLNRREVRIAPIDRREVRIAPINRREVDWSVDVSF